MTDPSAAAAAPAGEPTVIRVALDVPLRQEFDYLASPALRESLVPGARVRVPFGRRRMIGFVVDVDVEPAVKGHALRAVESTLDPPGRPALTEELVRLSRWIADYYAAGWGEALRAALPLDAAAARDETLADGEKAGRPKPWPHDAWVRLTETGAEMETALRAGAAKRPPGPAARRVLDRLANAGGRLTIGETLRLAEATRGHVRQLVSRGLAEVALRDGAAPSDEDEADLPDAGAEPERPAAAAVRLTGEQAAALALIEQKLAAGAFASVLLHGVTGSGKTEVYLRAIDRVLAAGRSAIVLVPEIVLTPPLQATLLARFGAAGVAIIHSRQGAKARADAWERARTGRARVVVGARSAVWAPLPDLGLIVVDEEHEPSYKQDQTPRYNGRDVAIVRAQKAGAVCLLCSATPSLETLQNARAGKYACAALHARATGAPMPEVEIVDMRIEAAEHRGGRRPVMSRRLREQLRATIDRGERAILFLNRRGHTTAIFCPRCGAVARCPDCDIALTYHQKAQSAICHYCYHRRRLDVNCTDCLVGKPEYLGSGTERLEEEIDQTFPGAGVLRLDTDAIRSGADAEDVLRKFRDGPFHVLVGTQMVAKGLDFEQVTLVGVTNADAALAMPDFRAAERTFQLLTQVAGRAGRGGLIGRTIFQTWTPDHYAIRHAARHDYESFAAEELEHRRALGYPPFSRLVRLVLRGARREVVDRAGQAVAAAVRRAVGEQARVLGPAPCPRAFLNKRWRRHVLVKAPTATVAGAATSAARAATTVRGYPRAVDLAIDVDPISLL